MPGHVQSEKRSTLISFQNCNIDHSNSYPVFRRFREYWCNIDFQEPC